MITFPIYNSKRMWIVEGIGQLPESDYKMKFSRKMKFVVVAPDEKQALAKAIEVSRFNLFPVASLEAYKWTLERPMIREVPDGIFVSEGFEGYGEGA